MSRQTKELYEFSRFRLNVAERLLLRDGKRVSLPDKAFDTLCALVRRGGELVGKDELMNEVWSDAIVEENNLDQKISLIRQALGERGKGKEKFIETVRGRGYRFLPAVRRVDAENSYHDIEKPNLPPSFEPLIRNPESEIRNPYEARRTGNVVRLATWRKEAEEAETTISGKTRENVEAKQFVDPEERPAAPQTETAAPALSQRKKRSAIFAAIALIAVAALIFTVYRFSGSRPASLAPISSIAVMPFVNETGSAESEYLSDGMAESLINSLSHIPNLSVKARSAVFQYKNRDVRAQALGAELSVQAVLFGRVAERGDRLTLNLELVDARTENLIWSGRYDRPQAEIVKLQSEIARDVSEKLRFRLTDAEEQRVAQTHTTDSEAYQLYLQGLYHLNKRTAEDIRKSITLFQQAADRDANYAKAYAWLAIAQTILPDYSHNLTRGEIREIELKRRAALQRAQELDDALPEIHVIIATLKEDVDFDYTGAERHYRRAIELNPSFALAYLAYSRLLGTLGRYDEALAAIHKAQELDPFSRSVKFNIGGRLADARRFDEAIAQYKKVLEMEPNHPLTHWALAMAYDAKGMFAEAIAAQRMADVLLEKETPADADRNAAALTEALKSGGARGYWQKRLEFSRREHEKKSGSAYKIAVVHARLDDRENALAELEKSLAARETELFWIRSESAFDPLRADPRFHDLLRRIGLPQ